MSAEDVDPVLTERVVAYLLEESEKEDISIDEVAKFLQATYREYYAVDFLALADQVDGVFDAMEEERSEDSLDSVSSLEELRDDDGTTNGDSLTEETTEANEAAEVTPPPPSVVLSTEQELVLMDALIRNKPAGMYKHFRMAVILEVTSAANVGLRLTSGDVWLFLGKLYHMERVEEIEVGHERALIGKSTFRLPRIEFAAALEKMREDERVGNDATLAGSDGDDDEEEEGKDWLSSGEQLYNPKPKKKKIIATTKSGTEPDKKRKKRKKRF